MKKPGHILLIAAMLLPLFSNGQDAKEGTVKIGKEQRSGFIAISDYEPEQVEAAIIAKLTEAGIKKHKKKKSVYTYKEVEIPAISPTKIDLYYRVDKKKKHRSKIQMVVSKGYDNYVSSATDATTAGNIVTFISQVDASVAHNEEIKQKELEVALMNQKLEKEKADIKKAEDEKRKSEKELEKMKNK